MQKDEIRERLAEIIWDVDFKEMTTVWCGTARNAAYVKADWMMERGATIAEDTNVPANDVSDTDFGKWIPVSEMLPKEGQSVLVYRVSKKMIAPHVSLCTYNGAREKNEWSRRTDHVMYWMPLPMPPKEET